MTYLVELGIDAHLKNKVVERGAVVEWLDVSLSSFTEQSWIVLRLWNWIPRIPKSGVIWEELGKNSIGMKKRLPALPVLLN